MIPSIHTAKYNHVICFFKPSVAPAHLCMNAGQPRNQVILVLKVITYFTLARLPEGTNGFHEMCHWIVEGKTDGKPWWEASPIKVLL